MHMPAFSAGTTKRIAVFYQSTVMTNTQVPAVREALAGRREKPASYLAVGRIAVTFAGLPGALMSRTVVVPFVVCVCNAAQSAIILPRLA